jgi:hypothetical protein
MRRSVEVGEWLAALERADDASAALAADVAVASTVLDAELGGPYEVFLSAKQQSRAGRPEPEPESEPEQRSSVEALLELPSSSDSEDEEPDGVEFPSVADQGEPTSRQPATSLFDSRRPRYERRWWADPLPRRSLFAAEPLPPPPPPPEPEPEPPPPQTWCTCPGHGATCSHDRRFLLPEQATAQPTERDERFGRTVHTVRFPRCNMRAAVTLAPGEVLKILLGSSALTRRDANTWRDTGSRGAKADLWRLHGRVDPAALRRSSGPDSTEQVAFTALPPSGRSDDRQTTTRQTTRVMLRCLRQIGGPTGYAWVDVTIAANATKRERESLQPALQAAAAVQNVAVDTPAAAARRHQARLLRVFTALDRDDTGHVSLTDLHHGFQRNRADPEISVNQIQTFLATRLRRSSVGLTQISFGEFVRLIAELPIAAIARESPGFEPLRSISAERCKPTPAVAAPKVQQRAPKAGSQPVTHPVAATPEQAGPVAEAPIDAEESLSGNSNGRDPVAAAPSASRRTIDTAVQEPLVLLPNCDVEFSKMLAMEPAPAADGSSSSYRRLVLWTAPWLQCAKPMRGYFRRLAAQKRTSKQRSVAQAGFALADITSCPIAAETVMAVPCFACYDGDTRVAEFEFAGENHEALELHVQKALMLSHTDLEARKVQQLAEAYALGFYYRRTKHERETHRREALELPHEIIESLLQHAVAAAAPAAAARRGSVSVDGSTAENDLAAVPAGDYLWGQPESEVIEGLMDEVVERIVADAETTSECVSHAVYCRTDTLAHTHTNTHARTRCLHIDSVPFPRESTVAPL